MRKLYEENIIQKIADNIRLGLKTENTMSIAEMADAILKLGNPYFQSNISLSPSHLDENGVWVRPAEYEDVGSLTWEHNEAVCYLSLSKNCDAPWMLGLYITAARGSQVEYGHVVNGEFVAIGAPELMNNNQAYTKVLPEDEDTLVAKITSQNYLYPITYFSFYNFPSATAGTAINTPYYFQPVVERVGNLPYITSVAGSGTTRGFGAAYMERDALKFGHFTSVTNLASAWQYCYNLEELDVNDIDTSRWKVASLANAWNGCAKLKKIDLSNWDTSTWVVNNMNSAFYMCSSLIDLRIRTWDTSNWAVTNLSSTFYNCTSLEKIDIENWNTSNWKVTTLASTFCFCIALKSLDLSKWNTSSWAVTAINNTFQGCYSLINLNLSTWNTTNWAVTSLSATFTNCCSLIRLDLNNWNTSNWAVTTMANIFQNCYILKYLLIDNWNTSNWAVTSLAYMFNNCFCLKELPIENWDVSNWKVTTMTTFAGYCFSLEKLDLSKWDTSNFALTTVATATSYCRNLKYLDVSTINTATLSTSTNLNFVANETNLQLTELYPQTCFNFNHSYANLMNLSKASIIRILNSLPRITASRTLTLGNLRAKIAVEDIAIATEKGWAVA